MEANFNILSFIQHSVYPERFAKGTFFGREIVIDTWSGTINATKFCYLFKGKAFMNYIRVEQRREDIRILYNEVKSVHESWKDIYNERDGLLIIEGNQEVVNEIGGTYVHFKAIIDLAIWCDKKLGKSIFKSIGNNIGINIGINSHNSKKIDAKVKLDKLSHNNDVKVKMESQTFDNNDIKARLDKLSHIKNDRERGKMSEIEVLYIFRDMFPDEEFILVGDKANTADIKCGNILIEIKNSATGMSKKNISKFEKDLYYQKSPLGIMVIFHGKSIMDFSKRIFFLNVFELTKFKDTLSLLFKIYKNKQMIQDNLGDLKYWINNLKTSINPLLNNRFKKYKKYKYLRIEFIDEVEAKKPQPPNVLIVQIGK